MYLVKIPKHGSSPTYLLRESYREEGKMKSRTIGNITSLGVEKITLISRTTVLPACAFHINRSRPRGHVAQFSQHSWS
jgi:hypothetical protein